jgi:hypothetical protein
MEVICFWTGLPAAMVVGNGFGKLIGVTQVGELVENRDPDFPD